MSNSNSESNGQFRRLTVWETFARLVSIYVDSAHARLFITLACLMVVPCTFVGMIIINYVSVHWLNTTQNDNDDTNDNGDATTMTYLVKNWAALALITISKLFFHNCAAIISDAAIVYTVAELSIGNTRPSWTTSLNVALRVVHHLFLAGFLLFVGVVIGYACFFVGGVWLAVACFLLTPVIVLEGKTSALEALQRSIQLTQGFRWHILACLAILFTLKFAVTHVLNMIFSGTGHAYSMWFSVWGYFINMIPASLFVPALAILKAVVYLSIRGEKEHLTADMLGQEMGHSSLLSPTQIFEYQHLSADEEEEGVALEETAVSGPAI